MAARAAAYRIADVRYWSPRPMSTRWSDNDVYGHLNNSWYSHFFDTIMNEYLITHCGLVPSSTDTPVALMVNSSIFFRRSISYPEAVIAGLSVVKLGTSSVVYKVGVWAAEEGSRSNAPGEWQGLVPKADEAFCEGELTHVFVDPKGRRPTPIPAATRSKLEGLVISPAKL